jgi:hypothetical protein
MVYPALLPLMRTPRLPAVDWTDAPADLNGLVRFAKRRTLVSARVIIFQTQSSTNTLVEDGPNHSPCPSSFLFRFLFFVFPFFLFFFVSYTSGSSATVLHTDSRVKDGFTSPVMTSYITRLHTADPVISLSSATHLLQTRSMFLRNSRTRVLQTEPVISSHWV